MPWLDELQLNTREEVHFGDRAMRCFSERPTSVDQLLREAIARNPDGDALVHDDVRISYAALDDIVGRVAANLAALGIGRGDRIALLLGNRPEFVYALMAAARLGAIAVPLNVREQTPGLEYVLNQSGARFLIHEAGVADRLPASATLPHLAHRFVVGGSADGARPMDELLQPGAAAPAPAAVDEEEVAVILYTSGTTGRPKGAMLTHLNICHSVMHFEVCMALGPDDRSILAVPASHVTGLVANVLTMVRAAGCTVMLPVFEARAFLDLAAREGMTHTLIVPAMYNLCLLRADFDEFDLSRWRIGGYGGAPMPEATIAALAEKLPELVLMNAYGATETTSPTTIMPAGRTAGRSDSVGWVVPCGEVAVMDEDGRPVAAGESGEIWTRGPMVVPGYWDNEEATTASFAEGYWRSGDIGAMDAEGFVRVFDRKKDMINRGGYKVYSAEVENTLSHHPEVIECAVIARPDPVLGEKVHAFVRVRQAEVSRDSLKAFCAARLSDYKVPDFVTVVDGPLPRNANGKILKAELRARPFSEA